MATDKEPKIIAEWGHCNGIDATYPDDCRVRVVLDVVTDTITFELRKRDAMGQYAWYTILRKNDIVRAFTWLILGIKQGHCKLVRGDK